MNLQHIRLDKLDYFPGNAKSHDIGQLSQLIIKHGFVAPILLDETIRGVNGLPVVKAGNGRLETSWYLMSMFSKGKISVPSGYKVAKDGMWLIPCITGIDSESEAEAVAFVVDDNNSTIMGGDFTALDVTRMYDNGAYVELLEVAIAHTLTVDTDDLALIKRIAAVDLTDPPTFEPPPAPEIERKAKMTLTFADDDERDTFVELMDILVLNTGVTKAEMLYMAMQQLELNL